VTRKNNATPANADPTQLPTAIDAASTKVWLSGSIFLPLVWLNAGRYLTLRIGSSCRVEGLALTSDLDGVNGDDDGYEAETENDEAPGLLLCAHDRTPSIHRMK
jgi:hypothetical protein